MASLLNTKISNTYVGLIKTLDNAVISSSLKELSDGSGNATGIHINNAGDLKVTNILEFGSLKDTGENITISKFVDAADGIGSNNNDTTIPTSAAVATYVAAQITLEDLDFSGDSGTGSVDLDSQVFAVIGTANEIETSAGSQQLQIGLPDNVTIGGNLQVNGLLKGNNNIVIKDTSDRTMAAFYGGDKVELYFNDSKKFETTSGGATVTGGITATGGSVFTGASFSSDVDFADNAKARFGDAQDFQIYHQGANSFIDESGTGNLYLRTSETLYIQRVSNGDNIAQFTGGGGSHLYFNNNLKISTTNTGIDVTGNVIPTGSVRVPDGEFLSSGNSNDLGMTHSGSEGSITNHTGHLNISNVADDSDIIFKSDDGSGGITTYFYLDGSGTRTIFEKLTRHDDNVKANFGSDSDLRIYHDSSNSYIEQSTGATGDLIIQQKVDDKDIIFKSDDNSGGVAEYFRLDGSLGYNVASKHIQMIDGQAFYAGLGNDLGIYHNGTNSNIENITGDLQISNFADDKDIIFKSDDGSGGTQIYFMLDGSEARLSTKVNNRFDDNIKAEFGTSGDLDIYHDGSNSYIQDNGTGNLYVQGSTQVVIGAANGEIGVQYVENAGVGLRHNNIQKLSTSSTGVTITGVAVADGLNMGDDEKIKLGDSQDLELYHSGSDSYIRDVGQGGLRVTASYFQVLDSANSETMIKATENSSVELYNDNSKKFETTSSGVSVTGNIVGSGNLTLDSTGDGATSTITLGGDDLGNKTNSILFAENRSSGAMTFGFTLTNEGSTSNNFIIKNHNNNASGTSALTIARDDGAISTGGNLTVAGDLTVNGTTTTVNTSTLAVEDPLISMAKDNSANSVDIGFYGKYNDGTNRYLGLFADASNSNKFKLFKGLTAEPTTTVDTTNAGFAFADLSINDLIANDITANNITASGDIQTQSKYIFNFGGGHYLQSGTNSLAYKSSVGTSVVSFNASSLDSEFAGDVTATSKKFISTSSSSGDYVRLYAGSGTAQWDIYGSGENLRLSENSGGGGVFQVDSGATFASDVNISNTSGATLNINTNQAGQDSKILLHEGTTASPQNGASIRYDGSSNLFKIGVGTSVDTTRLSIDRGTGNTTLSGSTDNYVLRLNTDDNAIADTAKVVFNDRGAVGWNGSAISLNDNGSNKDLVLEVGTGNLYFKTNNQTRVTIADSTGNATFAGSVNINNSSGDTLTLTKGTTEPSLRIEGDTDKDFVITVSGELLTFTQNDGSTDILTLDHDTKNATFAGAVTFDNIISGVRGSFVSTLAGATVLSAEGAYSGSGSVKLFELKRTGGAVAGDFSYDDATTDMSLGTNTNHSFSLKTNNTRALTIDTSQNANFAGNVTLSSASSPTLQITDTTNTVSLKAYSQDANSHIGTVTNHPLIIDTNNTAAITISTGQLVTFAGNVNLADNKKLRLGDSEDLQIYHDGSHSFIDNTKGYTYLRNTGANSQGIIIRNDDAGDIHLDNDFAGSIIFSTSNAIKMVIGSDGSTTLTNTAPLTPIIKAKSNQLNGYTFLGDNYASDESQVTIGIQYSSAGLVLGQGVKPSNDTNNKYLSTQDTYANKSSALVMAGGDFKFKNTSTSATTTTNTEVSLSERMRISNDGRLFLGTALGNIGAAQLSLQTNGGRGYGFNDTSGNSGTKANIFHSQATEVGSISINSSSTAYNTSSDYRLKEDLQDFEGLEMVSKIPVYDFKWKADDNRGYGVLAHELEEVLPQAVIGEKDAEDMQGVDYSKIVPLLVKSIQELKKEVDTLKKECKCN